MCIHGMIGIRTALSGRYARTHCLESIHQAALEKPYSIGDNLGIKVPR